VGGDVDANSVYRSAIGTRSRWSVVGWMAVWSRVVRGTILESVRQISPYRTCRRVGEQACR